MSEHSQSHSCEDLCAPRPTFAQAATGRAMTAALVLLLMGLVQYISVLGVFGPRLQQHFGITNRQLGTLFSCATVGSLLVLPFVGLAVSTLGVRRVAQASAIAAGGGMLLCGAGRGLEVFEVGVIVVGASASILSVAATSLLVALYPASKRRILSVTMAAMSLPGIVFPLLAQYLLSLVPSGDRQAFSRVLQGSFALAGVALLAGGAVFGRARFVGQSSPTSEPVFLGLRGLKSWPTLVIVFLAALHGAADQVLYQWLPRFMSGRFATLPIAPGVALSLAGVAYVVGRSLQAALPEGKGQRLFLVLPGLCGGTIMLFALWKAGPLAVGVLYPVAALIWCVEYPALISEIAFTSAGHFSTVLAGANLSQYLLGVVGTNAAGWLVDRTGSLPLGLTPAACGFILFGVIAGVTGIGRRAPLQELGQKSGHGNG
jgi:MFS family permease